MIGAEVTRPSGRELVFSRLIAAPVALVWEIWSDVRHLHEWFGPAGLIEVDVARAPGLGSAGAGSVAAREASWP